MALNPAIMNTLRLVFVVIGLLLSGCEIFYGPILKNVGKSPVDVAAVYSNGSSYTVHLKQGDAFRQRVKGLAVEKLSITQNGKTVEFGDAAIRPLMTHVSSSDQAVFLISESGLEIISIAEAKAKRD